MGHDVFKVIEVAGTSSESMEAAVRKAVERAGATLRGMSWFQVIETRGRVEGGAIVEWQVVVKIGFGLEAAAATQALV